MSGFSKTSRLYALMMAVLLLILVVSTVFAPKEASLIPSFNNPGPQGLMALRIVLEQIPGLTIRINDKTKTKPAVPVPAAPVPATPAQQQSLLIVEPAQRPYSEDEAQAILDQVKAGSRLLLLYNGQEGEAAVGLRAFNDKLKITIKDIAPEGAKPQEKSGIMAQVHKLDDYIFSVFGDVPDKAMSLAEVPNQGSLLIAMSYGQGQILAMSHLQLFNNSHLGDDDNARLAVQLLAPASCSLLQIDETHHLARPLANKPAAFAQAPFRAFALGLVLAALLFALNRQRRGGLRRAIRSPGSHAAANARALARLYRDSRDIDGLNQRLQQMAKMHGLEIRDKPAQDLDQWQTQMRKILHKIKS